MRVLKQLEIAVERALEISVEPKRWIGMLASV